MRRRGFVALTVALAACVALAVRDARARVAARDRDDAVHRASARLVGAELSLRGHSRAARHPTRVEPFAAMGDGPGVPDADPAGLRSLPP